eukprot:8942921-Alexandrium_andersonii.AAC.1
MLCNGIPADATRRSAAARQLAPRTCHWCHGPPHLGPPPPGGGGRTDPAGWLGRLLRLLPRG